MDAEPTERTPMLQSTSSEPQAKTTPLPAKASRSVTFNPQISSASPPRSNAGLAARPPVSRTAGALAGQTSDSRYAGPPMLSALNSKLRRRNSSGSPLQLPLQQPASKIGPQRTSRTAQKLKLLPNPEQAEDNFDESGRDVYSQFTRIKDPTARRDAARLGKDDRAKLPRVTAYCTASAYRLDDLMRFLKGRSKTKYAAPKLFDECIYSPYTYRKEGSHVGKSRSSNEADQDDNNTDVEVRSHAIRRFSDSALEVEENSERRREDLLTLEATTTDDAVLENTHNRSTEYLSEENRAPAYEHDGTPDFDTTVHIPEVFLFEYGVVVIWGMTVKEEQRFLKEISKFEQEKLGKENIQTEEFNFYYTREYQARIYNDFISLREKRNYMTKLAISHALAQSTKVSYFLFPDQTGQH